MGGQRPWKPGKRPNLIQGELGSLDVMQGDHTLAARMVLGDTCYQSTIYTLSISTHRLYSALWTINCVVSPERPKGCLSSPGNKHASLGPQEALILPYILSNCWCSFGDVRSRNYAGTHTIIYTVPLWARNDITSLPHLHGASPPFKGEGGGQRGEALAQIQPGSTWPRGTLP